jgi:hypothetical protein
VSTFTGSLNPPKDYFVFGYNGWKFHQKLTVVLNNHHKKHVFFLLKKCSLTARKVCGLKNRACVGWKPPEKQTIFLVMLFFSF